MADIFSMACDNLHPITVRSVKVGGGGGQKPRFSRGERDARSEWTQPADSMHAFSTSIIINYFQGGLRVMHAAHACTDVLNEV